MSDTDSLYALRQDLEARLLDLRSDDGCWRGRLAPSALANALACIALQDSPALDNSPLVESGIRWLCEHRNDDGGWGDTPESPSNLSTTLLCRAALKHCGLRNERAIRQALRDAAAWTRSECGSDDGPGLVSPILATYGDDRSFAAPILAVCAHTGLLGERGWEAALRLPYELALLPGWLYRLVRLRVVSYALPALIAVGLMIARGKAGRQPLRSALRACIARRLLKKLAAQQPASGGFLEAIPLTAFVVIGLTAAGFGHSRVVTAGSDFLVSRRRKDGSWPIDTDLAAWLTSEAVKALGTDVGHPNWNSGQTRDWLLQGQNREKHPVTAAAPGGWGWTDHPGAVPDADDTAGALLALQQLDPADPALQRAAEGGVNWLLGLQNQDGGVPTFCRGWGRLPFDRSCPDISAHALAAVTAWLDSMPTLIQTRSERFLLHAERYLQRSQHPDGSWVPLWFGNQHSPSHANPVFGTARVMIALGSEAAQRRLRTARWETALAKALDFLADARHGDGSWGGISSRTASTEETAAATAALRAWGREAAAAPGLARLQSAWRPGENGQAPAPAPIGLYFQSLWYSESLYPLLFTLQALRAGDRGGQGNKCAD